MQYQIKLKGITGPIYMTGYSLSHIRGLLHAAKLESESIKRVSK